MRIKVFEYHITYKNKNGETITRFTFAEDEDHAIANYYQSGWSNGAEFISCRKVVDSTQESDNLSS